MLIDVYQAQSPRNQVFINPILALIASMLVATTAAATVNLLHNEGGQNLNTTNPPLLPFDSAAPMPTSLSFKTERPLCRRQYGVDLKKDSCLDAWRSIPINSQQHTYGRRNRGRFDVPLPQRFLSGESGTL